MKETQKQYSSFLLKLHRDSPCNDTREELEQIMQIATNMVKPEHLEHVRKRTASVISGEYQLTLND